MNVTHYRMDQWTQLIEYDLLLAQDNLKINSGCLHCSVFLVYLKLVSVYNLDYNSITV